MPSLDAVRIEICGGIASGKTTLARILARKNITPTLERFRDNPFYEAFYRDPVAHAFETEIAFLLLHYHQIKIVSKEKKRICCDFSLVLDRAYAHVTLPRAQLRTFCDLQKFLEPQLPRRDLLIHLVCDADSQLGRIRQRGRATEAHITRTYLNALNESLARRVNSLGRSERVLSINSAARDFAHNEAVRRQVLKEIIDTVP